MAVQIHKRLGSYNWANEREKQWCVSIAGLPEDAPVRCLEETWPEDEEPDIEGEPPSIVVEMMSERLESYWLSTGRDAARNAIEWMREHAEELDDSWARWQIEHLDKKRAMLERFVSPQHAGSDDNE